MNHKQHLAQVLTAMGVKFACLRGIYGCPGLPRIAIDGAFWPDGTSIELVKFAAVGYAPERGINNDDAL